MRDAGCTLESKSADECIGIEPALAPQHARIAGGTYSPDDESGDAHHFTTELAARCAAAGVHFRYGITVETLRPGRSGTLESARLRLADGTVENLRIDGCVICLGTGSAGLLRPLGIDLRIYPVKGYSVTLPILNPQRAFTVSLTDDEYKLVYSRLGERLRIAGTAEFTGYDTTLTAALRRHPRRVAEFPAPLISTARCCGPACARRHRQTCLISAARVTPIFGSTRDTARWAGPRPAAPARRWPNAFPDARRTWTSVFVNRN
jgi:glycine/D-amino acid oxidase-like deaminating enzyme